MYIYKTGDQISFTCTLNTALQTGFKVMGCLTDTIGRYRLDLTEGGYITRTDSTHFAIVIPSTKTAELRQGNYKMEMAIYDTSHNVVVSTNEVELQLIDSATGQEAVTL